MKLRLNKTHFPVTALGPGRRVGIWFQGCSIGCPGCISRDTWSAEGGTEVAVRDVLEWTAAAAPEGYDGVTISGGEPFQQPEALAALLDAFDRSRGPESECDLLAYSGYSLNRLQREFPHILNRLDAVIPGPFVQRQAGGQRWRGSANQQIVPLSDLGRRRYGLPISDQQGGPVSIQVCVSDGEVWYIGVPDPGHMERLEAAARRRGVELAGSSWRA